MRYNPFMMIEHYKLTDPKPIFKDGDVVLVDMDVMGCKEYGLLPGKIVGKGMEHIIDHWMVQFERNFAPTYPYKVVMIQHTAFLKNVSKVNEMIETLKHIDNNGSK